MITNYTTRTTLDARRGRIAQSVERWSNKPLVMGSIPIVPKFFVLFNEKKKKKKEEEKKKARVEPT